MIHKSQKAPLTEITKTLGIKTKRGYELKDKLIREGLLKEDKIRKAIKGRSDEWKDNLIVMLCKTVKEIGDTFDIKRG